MTGFNDEDEFLPDSEADDYEPEDRYCAAIPEAEDLPNVVEPLLTENSEDSMRHSQGRYVVRSPEEIAGLMAEETRKAQSMMAALEPEWAGEPDPIVTTAIIECMLARRGWRADTVVEDFVYSPLKLAHEAGFDLNKIRERRESIHKDPSLVQYPADQLFECPITCEEVPLCQTRALPCGHRFSLAAWKCWINANISEGRVIGIKCMECDESAAKSLIEDCISDDPHLKPKLLARRTDAFIQANKSARHCPGRNCNMVIIVNKPPTFPRNTRDLSVLGYSAPFDCICTCDTRFCFGCNKEGHSPIPCEIISVWDAKNQSEADNMTWIFVNTKTCTQCKQPIEKNQGCMHMTCRCGYEFCWLCMGDWKIHGYSVTRCNVYDEQRKNTTPNPKDDLKKRAAESLERYAHFYERYSAHQQGQRIAREKLMEVLNGLETSRMIDPPGPEECRIDCRADVDARFIGKMRAAIKQIIEGRRILKYSYALGYYADWRRSPQAKNLYEHQQGELEWTLDKLQGLTEAFDFTRCLLSDQHGFDAYNRELSDITRVVNDFFNKMVTCFEVDVVPLACPEQPPSAADLSSVPLPPQP